MINDRTPTACKIFNNTPPSPLPRARAAFVLTMQPSAVLMHTFLLNSCCTRQSQSSAVGTLKFVTAPPPPPPGLPRACPAHIDKQQDMTGPVGGADPDLAGGHAHHSLAVGAGCQRLADAVHTKAAEGRFVLTVGGDHSTALGSVAGILRARPNARVLWVDAHADVNTPAGSPSGNMHGEGFSEDKDVCVKRAFILSSTWKSYPFALDISPHNPTLPFMSIFTSCKRAFTSSGNRSQPAGDEHPSPFANKFSGSRLANGGDFDCEFFGGHLHIAS